MNTYSAFDTQNVEVARDFELPAGTDVDRLRDRACHRSMTVCIHEGDLCTIEKVGSNLAEACTTWRLAHIVQVDDSWFTVTRWQEMVWCCAGRLPVLMVQHDFSPTIPVADIVAEAWKQEGSKCSKKDRSIHGAERL